MYTYEPRPRTIAEEQIAAYILHNKLKPHDKLPSERDMCAMWDINRSTLRSAVARLTSEGRLYSLQGSGTRILPRIERRLQDLKSYTVSLREQGFYPESRLLSFSTVECDKHLSRRFRRVLGEKLFRITRLRMADDYPVLIETAYIPEDLAPGLEEQDIVNGSLFAVLQNVYNQIPFRGWEKISITSATEEEAGYLKIENGAPVFWIISETYNRDDTLMEYCRTVGRADKMELTSTLHWRED